MGEQLPAHAVGRPTDDNTIEARAPTTPAPPDTQSGRGDGRGENKKPAFLPGAPEMMGPQTEFQLHAPTAGRLAPSRTKMQKTVARKARDAPRMGPGWMAPRPHTTEKSWRAWGCARVNCDVGLLKGVGAFNCDSRAPGKELEERSG